jgi:hypothetical protein
VPYVYTLEGRYKLVETARKKEVFTDIGMKDKASLSTKQRQQRLMFHRMTTREKV